MQKKATKIIKGSEHFFCEKKSLGLLILGGVDKGDMVEKHLVEKVNRVNFLLPPP